MAKKRSKKAEAKAKTQKIRKEKLPLSERLKEIWNSPVYRFLGIFVLFVVVFYLIYYSPFFERFILDPYTHWLAAVSSGILNIFGAGTSVIGDKVNGEDFSVSIKNGCDGMEVMALFLGAVVAFPIMRKLKWRGLFIGTVVLFVMNIFRIMGLYLSGVHIPSFFDALHIQGGFIIFTILCMGIWFLWANWALRKEKEMKSAAT